MRMRNAIIATLFAAATLLPTADAAARVVVRRTAHVTRVTVRPGFPIRRTLPEVVVRTTTVRVAPRVYLSPVVFGARIALVVGLVCAARPKDEYTRQDKDCITLRPRE